MWAAIGLVGILVVAFLNVTCFCYLQGRYLSTRELFELAIADRLDDMADLQPGETPASYLAKHPNCCSIPDFQPSNSVANLLLGYKIRYIRVVYRMRPDLIAVSPRDGSFYEAFVEISPCGRVYHKIGMRQATAD
ncbi:hypothetical protein [Bradyrhizobium sp. HKCCYLS20291]|uniref:hypothetical protein n=1 Tax=Bradyrhizobium sp. HKCCYLS20291 TaxID=3420766 RepID=UPI003EBBAB0D